MLKKNRIVILISILFSVLLGFTFLSNQKIETIVSALNKKPGEVVPAIPKPEKVNPQNAELLLSMLADSENSDDEQVDSVVDRGIIFKNLKKYYEQNGSVADIGLCDLLQLTEKKYDTGYTFDARQDLPVIAFYQSEYIRDNYCAANGHCEPLFEKLQDYNNAEDLKWILPVINAKSLKEVLNIKEDGDEIIFYKAMAYGNMLWAQAEDNVYDLRKSVVLFEGLIKKNPDNGIYPYFLMAIKHKGNLAYYKELNQFLNAKIWLGPKERLVNFMWLQAQQSLMHFEALKAKFNLMPKPFMSAAHDLMKVTIPGLSEIQKEKFKLIAEKLYSDRVSTKGLYNTLGSSFYAENWLRRLHDPMVSEIVDFVKLREGTIFDDRAWDRFYERISNGYCNDSELKEILKNNQTFLFQIASAKQNKR